ncbi:rhodanese-like domain-containing protein [Nocardia cyriacigeorgica]|jgi:rhodanese-related sulfurtransferase|uniref:Putative thiosulfate sulfurtransferase glpE n=1 Tax=Nocardia cyriacigeorgica (strain GUH-2) TaxID=1127134 RepID=H6R659_NOCCG|nr:rhodanese-like domain-containing protein [Nocardia cyriacigeorgica]AVH21789.1 sulfurtransferase [Nocardia cyriacigeorgica]MBF6285002.1 rhodanese-like domain-containing protein [Nocardia cyriacigeorgica]MBF6321287.1 rhodanese-like domain-containing protein [Nocardia cyriacigeorgica]MBF6495017.1 rhodanese-like domain-containing protein [Nocardia cyriacigeorgica]PPJ01699.1 sulfurtransferase [Nocardia cyriacigeorgica]
MTYAGDITPKQAWEILRDDPRAVLVDVRTEAEWKFVGIPDTSAIDRQTVLIEWVDGTGARNPEFAQQLRTILDGRDPDAPVVFLCRSGQRSAHAAALATSAGIEPSYNVSEGFEGPLDESGHRGGAGWRADGLPWRQS